MSAVSFSGLVSGLDTSSLITSLENAAKAPETQLQTDQSNLKSQETVLATLTSNLSSLYDAASTLGLGSEAQAMTATTSDDHVAIAVSGGAATGTHDLRVLQTAQALSVTSKTFASNSAGILGDGGVTIQRAGQADVAISWTSSDTLSSISDKINQAHAGVSASVLYDGTSYRLLVNSTASGTAAAPIFVDNGDSLGLADPSHVTVPAKDAKLSIDGVTVTRGGNVIDDVLAGATITLKSAQAATDPDTTASVAVDTTASQAKVQSLVDAFNQVATTIGGQLTYTGSAPSGGSLFGDSTLQLLQRSLGDLATGSQFGAQLANLGITMDDTGKLSIESDTFAAALQKDPTALKSLFSGGSGFVVALHGLVNTYTESGDGILVGKKAAMDSRIQLYQTEIDQIEANATALGSRLTTQFNALEQTLSKLKGQSSTLGGLLPTTTGTSSSSSSGSSSG